MADKWVKFCMTLTAEEVTNDILMNIMTSVGHE